MGRLERRRNKKMEIDRLPGHSRASGAFHAHGSVEIDIEEKVTSAILSRGAARFEDSLRSSGRMAEERHPLEKLLGERWNVPPIPGETALRSQQPVQGPPPPRLRLAEGESKAVEALLLGRSEAEQELAPSVSAFWSAEESPKGNRFGFLFCHSSSSRRSYQGIRLREWENVQPSNAEKRASRIDRMETMSLMPGSDFRGEIFAGRDGWVGGRFSGTLVVAGRLVLAESAEVQGVLVAGSIDVERGARVLSLCFVGPQGIEEWKRYQKAESSE